MSQPIASPSVTADAVDRDADQPPPLASEGMVSGGVCVELNLKTADVDPPVEGWIERHLARVAALAGVAGGRLCVALVDDMEMARLHERYKGVAGTTDVLTFDLRCRDDDPLDVDVVLCLDEAQRQARLRGHETRMELLLYAVHGLLHVTGHDDADPAAAAAMHAREDDLLVRAGFPSIFAAAGDPPLEVAKTDSE